MLPDTCGGQELNISWHEDGNRWSADTLHLNCWAHEEGTTSRIFTAEWTGAVVILASANEIRRCARCQNIFSNEFAMPSTWWTEYCRNSNGYFGSETTHNKQGGVDAINTWFLFLTKRLLAGQEYDWYKMNVFVRWQRHEKRLAILVFDAPTTLKAQLPLPLLQSPEVEACLADPFHTHNRFVEEIIQLQDEAVWENRTLIRGIEKHRPLQPDFLALHDLARHTIHAYETLDVARKTIGAMIACHQRFQASQKEIPNYVQERLLFFDHMIESLRCRATSNQSRLENEIQLAFNLVAQRDAQVSVKISRAAQSDGSAMKTVAFLTLAFLPATFISAIFSTSFFTQDSEGSWVVLDEFWVLWAWAIPVSVATIGLWYYWQGMVVKA